MFEAVGRAHKLFAGGQVGSRPSGGCGCRGPALELPTGGGSGRAPQCEGSPCQGSRCRWWLSGAAAAAIGGRDSKSNQRRPQQQQRQKSKSSISSQSSSAAGLNTASVVGSGRPTEFASCEAAVLRTAQSRSTTTTNTTTTRTPAPLLQPTALERRSDRRSHRAQGAAPTPPQTRRLRVELSGVRRVSHSLPSLCREPEQ